MQVDLDGIVGEITKIQEHYIEFAIWIQTQDLEDEADITGSVKWDGCVNWQTNPNCMAHFCSAHDMDRLNRAFKWVYAEASEKMPRADKSIF